jgi:hypothetical protein
MTNKILHWIALAVTSIALTAVLGWAGLQQRSYWGPCFPALHLE